MRYIQTSNNFIVIIEGLLVTFGTSLLWDGWMNHANDTNYCFPYCAYNPPSYIAADIAFTTVIIGFILVFVYVRKSRKSTKLVMG